MKKILFLCAFIGSVLCLSFEKPQVFIDDEKDVWVHLEDAELFCKVFGKEDASPVLILHGGPGLPYDYLSPCLSQLAESHRVVFYYQRGAGRSTGQVNRKTMRWDVFLNDLEQVRKAFNLKKVTLIGHCWGAALAMKYAMDYPDFVEKIVLIGSMPVSSNGCKALYEGYMKAQRPFKDEIQQIRTSPEFFLDDPDLLSYYCELLDRAHFYNPENAKLKYGHVSSQQIQSNERMMSLFVQNEVLPGFDWYNELQSITCPTLVVHGDSDFIPVEKALEIHENIPSSEYALIEKCGHCIFVEKPKELLQHLRRFLKF